MGRRERQAVVGLAVVVVLGAAIAWAGSQGGERVGGVPVFALCAALSFLINGLGFAHAYRTQTEHYFDLTGSLTYGCLTLTALALGTGDVRALLLAGCIGVWAGRLGSFLFRRVRRTGGDGRFDALKPSFLRFLLTWMLQALWVLITAGCALAAMTTADSVDLGPLAVVGLGVWCVGFAIEVTADRQKTAFRAEPANADRFIDEGLWSWSRHPNYFGEIVLWSGIAVLAVPALSGARYATLVSPVFVFVLLTRVSGVPLLERRGTRKWGEDAAYQAYLRRTPSLVPRPPRRPGDGD